ncbi:MAG: HU family DNA-binding protein [Planctomycetota bacterium]|nr:HU family DNA-binding protein [Planctomycetota bacterium]
MNKGELIEAVAQVTGESRAGAARMVDAVLGSIVDGVQRHERVSIAGFGTFRKRTRKARTVINPSTKSPMEIGASTTVGFTASEILRNHV